MNDVIQGSGDVHFLKHLVLHLLLGPKTVVRCGAQSAVFDAANSEVDVEQCDKVKARGSPFEKKRGKGGTRKATTTRLQTFLPCLQDFKVFRNVVTCNVCVGDKVKELPRIHDLKETRRSHQTGVNKECRLPLPLFAAIPFKPTCATHLNFEATKIRVNVGAIAPQEFKRMGVAVLNTLRHINNNDVALVVAGSARKMSEAVLEMHLIQKVP